MTGDAVLVKDLWYRYPQDQAWTLRGISLAVGPGELVVLGGYSGAGKTTLFYCINGAVPHLYGGELKGEVSVAGEEVDGQGMGRRARRVGTVMQDAEAQIFNGQVDDELAFGCENLGVAPPAIAARIGRYLPLTGVPAHRATAALSGGQKQRLTVAATLAMEQEVVLLDEPLANLDRMAATMLLEHLAALVARGRTVVMAEHRLDLVLPYATRLLWMEDGRIVDDLPIAEARLKYGQRSGPPLDPATPPARSDVARALLSLRRVTASINGHPVLRDLHFSLSPGEKAVILGENGCGKTTFLRLLAGMIQPDQGEYRQEGMPASRRAPPVGYVCQNPNYQLFAPSVFGEVDFQSEGPDNTRWFLELFGIAGLAERHPHALSEGQKRLVTIAAIAATKPAVLLLDEPTVGQDHRGLERLMAALEELNRRWHTALVVVTHDRRCVASVGGRVLYMEDGHLRISPCRP